MNKQLIEKATANPNNYAFENDGTVEQLTEVMNSVLLQEKGFSGSYKYYIIYPSHKSGYVCQDDKPENREIIKISEIFSEEPKPVHLSPEHIKLAMQNRWCKVPEGMEQAVTDRMNKLGLWADANIVRHCNLLLENIGLRSSRNGFTHGWDESYIDKHNLSEVPFSYFAALIGLEYKEPTIITYSIEPDGLKFGWKAESIPINEKTEAEINNFIERLKELKNENN